MSDFDPTIIWFIMAESFGFWLWPLLAAAIAALVVALAATWLVPAWTLAGADALAAPVDYVFAFLFALVPGGIAGTLVFFTAASRSAAKGRAI